MLALALRYSKSVINSYYKIRYIIFLHVILGIYFITNAKHA